MSDFICVLYSLGIGNLCVISSHQEVYVRFFTSLLYCFQNESQTAKEFCKLVSDAENDYQVILLG